MTRVVTLDGGEELQRALRKLSADAQREVGKEVNAAGIAIRTDIQKAMHRSTPTGKVYTKPSGIKHRASAPNEPPAVDTGRLVNSITFRSTGPLSAEVFSDVEYGPMLEFGTMRIIQRPAWVPAVERIQPKFIARVIDAIRRSAP